MSSVGLVSLARMGGPCGPEAAQSWFCGSVPRRLVAPTGSSQLPHWASRSVLPRVISWPGWSSPVASAHTVALGAPDWPLALTKKCFQPLTPPLSLRGQLSAHPAAGGVPRAAARAELACPGPRSCSLFWLPADSRVAGDVLSAMLWPAPPPSEGDGGGSGAVRDAGAGLTYLCVR